MTDKTRQEQEIQTIAPRTLTLNLSAADCQRIAVAAGACGLTVAELLENFIGDLVHGTYTNGSDERDYAQQYVSRCWFGSTPPASLLQALLAAGEGMEGVEWLLDAADNLAFFEDEAAKAPDAEERRLIQDDIAAIKKEIAYFTAYYPAMTDFAAEIKRCRQWADGVNRLKAPAAPQAN